MPLGLKYIETGLLKNAGPYMILERDEGGRWRPDGPQRFRLMIGKRVRLEGTRVEFDMVVVTSMKQLSQSSQSIISLYCHKNLIECASELGYSY